MSWTVKTDNITFKGHPLKIDSATGIVTTEDVMLNSIINLIFDMPIVVEEGAELSLRQAVHLILMMLPTLKPCAPCKPPPRPHVCRPAYFGHNIY
jgi:hypothetical protein